MRHPGVRIGLDGGHQNRVRPDGLRELRAERLSDGQAGGESGERRNGGSYSGRQQALAGRTR
ncbi:MAG: hypothetical protein ACREON_01350 [Gemmatimonadaceae bacterium]